MIRCGCNGIPAAFRSSALLSLLFFCLLFEQQHVDVLSRSGRVSLPNNQPLIQLSESWVGSCQVLLEIKVTSIPPVSRERYEVLYKTSIDKCVGAIWLELYSIFCIVFRAFSCQTFVIRWLDAFLELPCLFIVILFGL